MQRTLFRIKASLFGISVRALSLRILQSTLVLRTASDLHTRIQSGCEFVSFSDGEESRYFIKHKARGSWNAHLDDLYLNTITQIREQSEGFDAGLQYIIFGKGGTHIYQHENGFALNWEGNHEDPDHPFRQACSTYLLFCLVFTSAYPRQSNLLTRTPITGGSSRKALRCPFSTIGATFSSLRNRAAPPTISDTTSIQRWTRSSRNFMS